MKRQYLGDAKDAFKWDYLDFLTRELGMQLLNILLMLTPDDETKEGESNPRLFPAPRIWPFCEQLRAKRERDFGLLRGLPNCVHAAGPCDSQYEVRLHNGENFFCNAKAERGKYFSGIARETAQVVFADPDVGFEPPSGGSDKHILFSDVGGILEEMSQESILVVFQHAKQAGRKGKGKYFYLPFDEHYREILPCLPLANSQSATAIFWCDKAMFVAIGNPKRIEEVRKANRKYMRLSCLVQVAD